MEGQWIVKNTVVAQELTYKMKKHRGENRLMIIKVDMKNAYERLELSFLY